MPKTIEWVKPCGLKVTTNTEEATIKAAVDLGWKQPSEDDDEKKPVAKPKK